MSLINYLGICLVLILYSIPFIAIGKILPAYISTEIILLNCGGSSDSTSLDGRKWASDVQTKFGISNFQNSSSAFTASKQDPSLAIVPYLTARIFHSPFTYTFPVSAGPKFVRLYFNPSANYSNFDISKSFFSLKANKFLLLYNFSAFLTVSSINPKVAYMIKEYIISVPETQVLNITFSPFLKSFAFVNGIEIISMPHDLYARGFDNPLNFVGIDESFYLDTSTALETIYRLNVGGADIDSSRDTGMYRKWAQDSDYIFGAAKGVVSYSDVKIKYTITTPTFVAPIMVYSTMRSMGPNPQVNRNYNLTWIFPVETGFLYLVRLHFCETRLEVVDQYQLVFSIFINNQTAEKKLDVIFWGGGNGVPVYKDYIVWFPAAPSKQDLWLALHPNLGEADTRTDAFLNGLEIFKLNNSEGSLAGRIAESVLDTTPPQQHPEIQATSERKKASKIIIVIGPVFGGVLALVFLTCLFFLKQRRREKEDSIIAEPKSFRVPFPHTSRSTTRNSSLKPSNQFRRFSVFEIEIATSKFDDEYVIGSGGFGNVYKGSIDDGTTTVAIKRLHSSSKQGAREFKTEIQMLSQRRHMHLVSLIGYCDDPGEMILVYEYMHRGTLRDHLYKTKNPPLPWKRRLQICIGAAHGLHYLHTGAKHSIIHRDVKSTNILIDENWVAKVSDFGLSRMGPTSDRETHVSTVVKGSIGYVDPEYYRRQHLTEKSDAYSFGVVLLEVLCARPPVIPGLPKEKVNLADWARICYRRGALDEAMDPHLRGDIDAESLEKFVEIAESCLRENGAERPTMSGVVWGLELALQLQERAEQNRNGNFEIVCEEQESPLLLRGQAGGAITDEDDIFSVSGGQKEEDSNSTVSSMSVAKFDPDGLKSETAFSEIMNPMGR